MTFDQIFEAYYNLYRAEADTPTSSDNEYTIALRLANEALNRWANYDATYWKELFSTNQRDGTGVQVITTGTTAYAAPTNMREAGGYVRVNASNGTAQTYFPILNPEEVQFRSDTADYAYFTGDPNNGFVLNLNRAPASNLNGLDIDYVYYKKPTEYTTGASKSEIPNPYFVVHRMLAQRFRVSRNPYYSSALRDAEEALKIMKMDNDSGTWANPWKLADNSATVWGGGNGNPWTW